MDSVKKVRELQKVVCAICDVVTEGRKIRGFWNNRLCETCGEETSEVEKPHQESQTSEESDCLANNPRCPCGLLLNDDDMFAWRRDESKTPKCEGCLDEEKTSDIWFRLTKDDVIASYEGLTGKSEMPEEVWQKFLSLKPNGFIGEILFDYGLDPIGDILTKHCGVKPESTLNSQETDAVQTPKE